ncbi:mitochondrial 54S ribosomal protein mL41 [Aspergillus stella-maris]|uniref:mitochondrial 54S ribosomal protein mL41 n=1 Tax=Aspergillus stella-maris TaxID=1810926 RepID=UPI003CCD77EC
MKPSQPMMARLRLTTKQVGPGYYKGNRTGSMGYFAKNGSFVIDWKKVRTYNVPEGLKEFQLTPFVTKNFPSTRSRYVQDIERKGKTITVQRALGAKDFLDMWANDNGREVAEQQEIDEAEAKKATRTKAARK